MLQSVPLPVSIILLAFKKTLPWTHNKYNIGHMTCKSGAMDIYKNKNSSSRETFEQTNDKHDLLEKMENKFILLFMLHLTGLLKCSRISQLQLGLLISSLILLVLGHAHCKHLWFSICKIHCMLRAVHFFYLDVTYLCSYSLFVCLFVCLFC